MPLLPNTEETFNFPNYKGGFDTQICGTDGWEYKLLQTNFFGADYDPNIFDFYVTSSNPVIVYLGSDHNDIKNYTAGGAENCQLWQLGTRECQFEFVITIINTQMNYTMSNFVHGTYTIKSECLLLHDNHIFDWWSWPNYEDFAYGYDIRNETLVTVQLPQLFPILDSGNDVFTLCGNFLYELKNPESEHYGYI